jgi:hypothetical protein
MKRTFQPEHYLKMADEIRAIAQQIDEPTLRQKMEGIAEDYERMAREAIASNDSSPFDSSPFDHQSNEDGTTIADP